MHSGNGASGTGPESIIACRLVARKNTRNVSDQINTRKERAADLKSSFEQARHKTKRAGQAASAGPRQISPPADAASMALIWPRRMPRPQRKTLPVPG